MKKNNIKILCFLIFILGGVLLSPGINVCASAINTNGTELEMLSGDAWYVNRAEYYYLDSEEIAWNEAAYSLFHAMCNGLFGFIRWFGKIVTVLFYYCMDFDIAKLFNNEIRVIQGALNTGIFRPLFLLGFCGSAAYIIKKMFKRDYMGAYGELLKVVLLWVLSYLVVSQSATALSAATGLTKAISAEILFSLQNSGQTSISSYAAESAGVLWVNLVHQPWKYAEFGNEAGSIGSNVVADLLSPAYANGTEARLNFVETYPGTAFAKERLYDKGSFLLLYTIPMVFKGVIFIVMAVFMLGYQAFAVFYVLLAPIILLLAMIPGYEKIVSAWLKKFLETQLGILVLSFAMGLLILLDNLMYTYCSHQWGWMIVVIVQTVVDGIVILKRDELLSFLGNLQRAGTSPGYANAMVNRANSNAAITTRNLANKSAEVGVKYASRGISAGGRALISLAEHHAEKKELKRENMERQKHENEQVISGNTAQTAQNAQIQKERPRLDNQRIIKVEAVNGRIERVEEPIGVVASINVENKPEWSNMEKRSKSTSDVQLPVLNVSNAAPRQRQLSEGNSVLNSVPKENVSSRSREHNNVNGHVQVERPKSMISAE